MKTLMKTWLVLALGIGMAGMASAGEGWGDEPLKWEAKGEPEAATMPERALKTKPTAAGTRRVEYDGEKHWIILSNPGKEPLVKGAEEQAQPDVPEQPEAAEPEAPPKKSLWKKGGEKALDVLKICGAGAVGIIVNFPWLVRLLIH